MPEIDEAFALLEDGGKKYTLHGTSIFDGARKIGSLRGEVLNAAGSKIGGFRENAILDKAGIAQWHINGGVVYERYGKKLTTVQTIKRQIAADCDVTLVALYLLLLIK